MRVAGEAGVVLREKAWGEEGVESSMRTNIPGPSSHHADVRREQEMQRRGQEQAAGRMAKQRPARWMVCVAVP